MHRVVRLTLFACVNVCLFFRYGNAVTYERSTYGLLSYLKRNGTGMKYDRMLKLYVSLAGSWLFYSSISLKFFCFVGCHFKPIFPIAL